MGGGIGPALGFLRWGGEPKMVERMGMEEEGDWRRVPRDAGALKTFVKGLGGLGLRRGAKGDSGFLDNKLVFYLGAYNNKFFFFKKKKAMKTFVKGFEELWKALEGFGGENFGGLWFGGCGGFGGLGCARVNINIRQKQ